MADQHEIAGKLPQILMRALASTYELYYSSQVAHWNVEGPDFIQLHAIFKDSYESAATTIDEVAERIRQLETKIPESLNDLLKQSPITSNNEKNFVERLYLLHEFIENQWNSIATVANAAEDSATVDMAGKKAATHGKFCWILRSIMKEQN